MADGGYGLRVAKPGFDANANPVEHENLVFNSDWGSTMPVFEVGSILNVSRSLTVRTYTFSEDLGYIPIVNIYFRPHDLSVPGIPPGFFVVANVWYPINLIHILWYSGSSMTMNSRIYSNKIDIVWNVPAGNAGNQAPSVGDFLFVIWRTPAL